MLEGTGTWADEEDVKASTFFHLQKVIVETHGLSSYGALDKTPVPQSTSACSSALTERRHLTLLPLSEPLPSLIRL